MRVLGWVSGSVEAHPVKAAGSVEEASRDSASCSSHVEVGGGVALDSISLKCARTSGPSHVEEGGGDALQGFSLDMDRSSPGQSERFRAEVDRHNVDTTLGGF
jgi:hypothetical protein